MLNGADWIDRNRYGYGYGYITGPVPATLTTFSQAAGPPGRVSSLTLQLVYGEVPGEVYVRRSEPRP